MENFEDLESAVSEFATAANDRLDQLARRLDDIESTATARPGRGRQTEPDPLGSADADRPRRTRAQVLGPVARHSGSLGFSHAGEFFAAVKAAGLRNGTIDERLMAAAPSTYGNEGSGTDGGFAVPADYRANIMQKAFGEDSLIARTMRVVTGSNTLTIPTDMTTPWQSTGGIQAYWEGEASTLTQSKPSLQNVTVRLHKLTSLVPVTDELLEDAPALGTLVSSKAAEKIDFEISNTIIRGTGAGQPLGILNAPALVTQAAETSQVADTVVAENVVKMAARMPVASRRNAVWLVHPDAEPQLPLMTIGDQPVFVGPGGFRDDPFGRLLGRPVIPHQTAETLGDLGDLMFCDFSQYLTAVKANGLCSETSIHLWFDQDMTAFRFIIRVAGMPWWSEATASRDGNFTQSPFVVLAART